MEKTLQQDTSYKSISAMENTLLSKISESNTIVFGVRDIQRLTDFSKTTVHNLLTSLKRKGIIVMLLRDKYCLKKSIVENNFAVASNTFVPSYISFWSALSFYGFTEQQISIVQIASPKQFKRVELDEIVIHSVTIKTKNFFGYVRKNNFVIASKEKALVDSALHFENAGGFDEFIKCLKNAWNEINKELFVKYLLKTNNKSLNSRIGFIIEDRELSLSKKLLKKLQLNCSKSFVKLNPSKNKSNKYNKNWRIIINYSFDEEEVL